MFVVARANYVLLHTAKRRVVLTIGRPPHVLGNVIPALRVWKCTHTGDMCHVFVRVEDIVGQAIRAQIVVLFRFGRFFYAFRVLRCGLMQLLWQDTRRQLVAAVVLHGSCARPSNYVLVTFMYPTGRLRRLAVDRNPNGVDFTAVLIRSIGVCVALRFAACYVCTVGRGIAAVCRAM